ncbi:MAG: hypothetical protein HY319_26085 [Armatimonadetes bacterium]|nr:hypothetical protein [Armatimonadota bacterium]
MRTTVNIPDHLLVEAKKLAATRKISLTTAFEESHSAGYARNPMPDLI